MKKEIGTIPKRDIERRFSGTINPIADGYDIFIEGKFFSHIQKGNLEEFVWETLKQESETTPFVNNKTTQDKDEIAFIFMKNSSDGYDIIFYGEHVGNIPKGQFESFYVSAMELYDCFSKKYLS